MKMIRLSILLILVFASLADAGIREIQFDGKETTVLYEFQRGDNPSRVYRELFGEPVIDSMVRAMIPTKDPQRIPVGYIAKITSSKLNHLVDTGLKQAIDQMNVSLGQAIAEIENISEKLVKMDEKLTVMSRSFHAVERELRRERKIQQEVMFDSPESNAKTDSFAFGFTILMSLIVTSIIMGAVACNQKSKAMWQYAS